MIKTLLTGLAAFLFLPAMGEAQTARSICAERDRIVATLTGPFRRNRPQLGHGAARPDHRGLRIGGNRNWTITVTAPDGTTCLVASGNAWQDLAQPPRGAPA